MIIQDEIKNISTDVLIVGGGMAACFAAVEAKRNGVQVLMVDKGRHWIRTNAGSGNSVDK